MKKPPPEVYRQGEMVYLWPRQMVTVGEQRGDKVTVWWHEETPGMVVVRTKVVDINKILGRVK